MSRFTQPVEADSIDFARSTPPGVTLAVAEAARSCRVDPIAIDRLLDAGTFPNATRDDDGAWRIPVVDLEAVGLRPRRHLYLRVAVLRIAFGVLFAVDAALKWRPSFARATFLDEITGAAAGQPGWLHPWFRFWARLAGWAPTPFAYSIAVVETIIALALIFGIARQLTYVAATVYSLGLWAIPEGFGGPYPHSATDVGSGILYAVVFAALYQLDTLADESPLSLDPLIERRLPWWRLLSEPTLRVKGGGTGQPSIRRNKRTSGAR